MHGKVKLNASRKLKYFKTLKKENVNNTDKLKFQADASFGTRYQVVNLQNRQTIEIRSF